VSVRSERTGSESARHCEQETTLANNSKSAQERAEANFKKDQRARDGAKAMAEYEAAGVAMRKKTERLKALRLAKEAADLANETGKKPAA
jgi:hypothetical protein